MSGFAIFGLIVVVMLGVYLVVALMKPEDFQ